MAKNLKFIILIFLSVNLQVQAQPVIYSVQAHQDDWQLFMSSKIIGDLNDGSKAVFITLTAGDASCGNCSYSPIGPYYLGRETGSVYSSKFAADLTTGTASLDVPVATTVTVNGKTLTKYIYKNTVNYFFNFPDGNGNGSGFSTTGFQSLQRLKSGAITAMNVIGHTTSPPSSGPPAFTYTWCQLLATIKQIINLEKIAGQQGWIYSASLDAVFNPNDHSDHIYSSTAAREAVSTTGSPCNNTGLPWVGINGFADYASFQLGPNLNVTDHENASIVFGLCVWGMTEFEYQSDFNTGHQDWLPMDWFSIFRNPSGTALLENSDNSALKTSDNIVSDLPEPGLSSLTSIPMVVSVTGPIFIDTDIKMVISPFEPGQLNTSVYDMAGNKVYGLTTKVTNREPLFVTLTKAIKTKGTYVLKNVLNDKYSESLKIVVE